ncbi:MAG: hypothetical protein U0228_12290 [Myxococcaceae bacterium]
MSLALLIALTLAADPDAGAIAPSLDAGPAAPATRPSLLREARVMRADGCPNAALMADGVASQDGDVWNNPRAALLDKTGAVEWELVEISTIRHLRIQADNNDRYLVSVSVDGTNWQPFWVAGPVDLPGVQTRTSPELPPVPVRFVRLTADSGDSMYSITELEAFDSTAALRGAQLQRVEPAPPPPPPPAPPFDTGFVVVFVVAGLGWYYVVWARRELRAKALASAPAKPVEEPAKTDESKSEPPKAS